MSAQSSVRKVQEDPNSGIYSPAVVITQLFTIQSYFDSTLLQNAILSAPSVSWVIPSTTQANQFGGHAVGLHPSSQAPVAVEFTGSGVPSKVLKPGEVFRPSTVDGKVFPFAGFKWGLPQGWLGGGVVQLVIFQSPDADVLWHGNTEVLFHRMRVPLKQTTDLTAGGGFNNAPLNWPMRFPWTQAQFGANKLPQQNKPVMAITEGTRTMLVLRPVPDTNVLAGPAKMRIIYQGTNDFGTNSSGAVVQTDPVFEDVTWGPWANVGTSGNLATQHPYQLLTSGITRLAADDGGVVFVDENALMSGWFCDVVRYGRL